MTFSVNLRTLSIPASPPQDSLSTREAYLERDSKHAGISFLTLNRPAAKNALSPRLVEEFRAALNEVRFDG